MSDRRPRVGYVLKMYPRLAETFILNEILAHEAAGCDIDIFSLRAPIDGRFHGDLGRVRAEVTYLGGHSVKSGEFWSRFCNAAEDVPNVSELIESAAGEDAGDVNQAMLLAEAVRARGITHLHAHFATVATTIARLAARMTGIPYSFTAHAKDIFHESVVADDLRRKLAEAHTCVTVSDFNVDYLRDRFNSSADSVRRIYNGIAMDEFPYESPRDRAPIVLGVGRLVDKKGFADLIEAAAILRDRQCTFGCEIIGDGVVRPQLEKLIDRLDIGSHVTLLGARSRAEVRRRMRDAAVIPVPCVVSPSGNRDGLPTVLLEAMATGTPCISTDVTGIPEIIHDGETGLMVPQHDPISLADAIERTLNDPELRVRLAENARALVEDRFDIRRNTARMREVFSAQPVVAEVR